MSSKNLSSLLSSIESVRKTKTVGGLFEVSELTLSHQKNLLTTVFDQYEAPVRLADCLDSIIQDCVKVLGDEYRKITVLERPYLLRTLRDITVGSNKFVKKTVQKDGSEKKETFDLPEIDFKDLRQIDTQKEIKVNDYISIFLYVPSLDEDRRTNQELLNALSKYRASISGRPSGVDGGHLTGLYLTYELVKFIDKISVNEEVYDFAALNMQEKQKVVNNLPQSYITEVSEFIQTIKNFEEKAFTGTNQETGETETLSIDQTIFSKEV